jgi:hypothetical protein
VVHVPETWSPDGRTLLYSRSQNGAWTLWALNVADRKSTPYSATSTQAPLGASFSPDGRWVAYAARAGASHTVYAEPFPATGARYELPRKAGDDPHHPVWTRDGKALFYTARPGEVESVSVSTMPAFSFGNPAPIPRAFRTAAPTVPRVHDILPDGRFVGFQMPGVGADNRPSRAEIRIVRNWLEELKGKLAPR